MTHYAGPLLSHESVAIGPPPAATELLAVERGDEFGDYPAPGLWFRQTATDDNSMYFALLDGARVVGQVMLHDVVREDRSSLVGYHVFRRSDRGRGRAAVALRLLLRYVVAQTDLTTLAALTDRRNIASQRVATRAGFQLAGTARDGPDLLVFRWARGSDESSVGHVTRSV